MDCGDDAGVNPVALWPRAVRAGRSVKDYETSKNDPELQMHIFGLGQGSSWANAELGSYNKQKRSSALKKIALHGGAHAPAGVAHDEGDEWGRGNSKTETRVRD